MALNLIDRIGNWNPQLLRELKGCLKTRNVLLTVATSLLSQYLLFQWFQLQLPTPTNATLIKYCPTKDNFTCFKDAAGHVIVNWHLWWLDIFVTLSAIGIFTLVVAGTYMLIANLAREERRGTLNFIRLSPQSTQSILIGKLLGVPCLLYLAAILAIPLYVWSGLASQIPLGEILGFGGIFICTCILFYSAALLYSLTTGWLGGFQAWVGSGTVLAFLMLMQQIANRGGVFSASKDNASLSTPIDWMRLFGLFDLIPHLSSSSFYRATQPWLPTSQWFYLPVGASIASLTIFALLNCGLWGYWIWEGLKRCFRNPNATILSKRQSYLLVACFAVSTLGFAVQRFSGQTPDNQWVLAEFILLSGLNWLLFFYLMAALSPQRQVLQDWTRYRKKDNRNFWQRPSVRDLIWGEKSPAVVAIAINLVIATTPTIAWILLSSARAIDKTYALISLAIFASLVLIYTIITQLMLLLRTQNRVFWTTVTVGAIVILPPIILGLLTFGLGNPLDFLWLFSPAASLFLVIVSLDDQKLETMKIFVSLLGEWSMLVWLNLLLTWRLRQLGESASKALFAGRSSLPSS